MNLHWLALTSEVLHKKKDEEPELKNELDLNSETIPESDDLKSCNPLNAKNVIGHILSYAFRSILSTILKIAIPGLRECSKEKA